MKERDFCYWLKGILSQVKDGETMDSNTVLFINHTLHDVIENINSSYTQPASVPNHFQSPIVPYRAPQEWVDPFKVTCESGE